MRSSAPAKRLQKWPRSGAHFSKKSSATPHSRRRNLRWIQARELFIALFDIERETVRIADIAARYRRIFLDHGAAGRQQRRFGGVHVRHQKVEHRAMLGSRLDEQAECAALKAGQ